MGPASPVPGLSCRKQMKGKADMKKRVISILLALVMAFGLCVPALAADEFEAEGPATPVEEEIPAVTEEETEDVPDPVAGSTDLVVLGDSSGITGYSHIGIGSMHSFVIGLATDYVLTTNLGTIDEILYTCNIRTGAVTGQVSISYTGASPLVVTVTKEPGSYPVPLEIHYDPIDLLTDADTAPKYALPGSLLLIEVKDGYEINPDSRNFTILEDSRGSAGRVLQIFISKSATELNITSDSVVAPTPTPVPTPTPAPTPDPIKPPAGGTGWRYVPETGDYYYFKNNKRVGDYWVGFADGASKWANNWYYADATGKLLTGFQYLDDLKGGKAWYMLQTTNDRGEIGKMLTGWQETFSDARMGYFSPKYGSQGMCTWTENWGNYNAATGLWADGLSHRG